MRAVGGDGHQRSCHFVFTLRATFEARHLVVYAPA